MKSILLIFAVLLSSVSALGALDLAKVAQYETSLAPLMGTDNPKELQSLVEGRAPSAAPLDQVRAGLAAVNLSRTLGAKGTKGWAAKASEWLSGPAQGPDAELAVLALSFWGTAQTLQGNEDPNPAAKITFVNQGWTTLGQAIDRSGEASWVPRFYRISVGQALPDFFNKGQAVLDDLKALKAWDRAHPGRMVSGIQAQLALYEGNALKKHKDLEGAVDAWNRALALDPQKSGAGKAAAAALDLYGE